MVAAATAATALLAKSKNNWGKMKKRKVTSFFLKKMHICGT